MQYKTCSKCGNDLPETSEYFHRHCRNRSGFNAQCKACRNAYMKEYQSRPEVKRRRYEYQAGYQAEYMRKRYQDTDYRLKHNARQRELRKLRREQVEIS